MSSQFFNEAIEAVYYDDLRELWVKAHRNGNIRKLDLWEKALFKACMAYSKIAGKIRSRRILEDLKKIMEKLKSTPRIEALKAGFRKAHKWVKGEIIKLFPKMLDWIKDKNYILYIGFMEINNPPHLKINL